MKPLFTEEHKCFHYPGDHSNMVTNEIDDNKTLEDFLKTHEFLVEMDFSTDIKKVGYLKGINLLWIISLKVSLLKI